MAGKGRMKILQRSVEEDLVSGGDKVLQERLGTWEVSEQASGACGGGEVCQSEKLRQSCTKWK